MPSCCCIHRASQPPNVAMEIAPLRGHRSTSSASSKDPLCSLGQGEYPKGERVDYKERKTKNGKRKTTTAPRNSSPVSGGQSADAVWLSLRTLWYKYNN